MLLRCILSREKVINISLKRKTQILSHPEEFLINTVLLRFILRQTHLLCLYLLLSFLTYPYKHSMLKVGLIGFKPDVHFVFSTPEHFVMHSSGWIPPSHHPLHFKCSFRHQLFQTPFSTNASHAIELLVLYYHILCAYLVTLLITLLCDCLFFFFYCIFHHCAFLLKTESMTILFILVPDF